MATQDDPPAASESPAVRAGGCACRAIRYRLEGEPLVVHACHCRDCQRLTGGAFVVNLWMETDHVVPETGLPRSYALTGGSGRPHEVFFCGSCGTYVWSRYHRSPGRTLFVRGGTLDEPGSVTPDVHIHTASKVPWLTLPEGVPAFAGFYDPKAVWAPASLARFAANVAAAARA